MGVQDIDTCTGKLLDLFLGLTGGVLAADHPSFQGHRSCDDAGRRCSGQGLAGVWDHRGDSEEVTAMLVSHPLHATEATVNFIA